MVRTRNHTMNMIDNLKSGKMIEKNRISSAMTYRWLVHIIHTRCGNPYTSGSCSHIENVRKSVDSAAMLKASDTISMSGMNQYRRP